MLDFLFVWFFKSLLRERLVMAVYEGGVQQVKRVHFTKDDKAYVYSEGKKVGFLDQPSNHAGEFRKGISDDNLKRWFDL
jgi:hypothetical protein